MILISDEQYEVSVSDLSLKDGLGYDDGCDFEMIVFHVGTREAVSGYEGYRFPSREAANIAGLQAWQALTE